MRADYVVRGRCSVAYQILLVDDDNRVRELIRTYLSEFYDVVEAATGPQALDILKKPNQIDVVILDVMMPGMTGIEVLKKIKKSNPALGIIMLTANSTKDVAVAALKGHADDFVEKPFSVSKMKEVIEEILRSKNGSSDLSVYDTCGKIEMVQRFTERNFDKNVSLRDAAASVCLSPKYLSRIFKRETGSSFAHFKMEMKIKKAQDLLMETGCNISQISDKLGYQNVETFVRAFRKIAGCTASEYRNITRPKQSNP